MSNLSIPKKVGVELRDQKIRTMKLFLCGKNCCAEATGSVPVYLNVYDVNPINNYAYWFGLGVFHSGLQVHGVEYAFGAHESPTTGIFEQKPKHCDGFRFRKGILIGWTKLNPTEVKRVMDELAAVYRGTAYNLIKRNCNHFCNDACTRLTGNPIPSWVNRLARIGYLCNCVIPASLTTTRIGPPPESNKKEDEGKANKATEEEVVKNVIDEGQKKLIVSSSSSSSRSSSSSSRRFITSCSKLLNPISPR